MHRKLDLSKAPGSLVVLVDQIGRGNMSSASSPVEIGNALGQEGSASAAPQPSPSSPSLAPSPSSASSAAASPCGHVLSLRARFGRPLTIHNNLGGTGPWFDAPRVLRFAAVTWVKMVVPTEELATALQHFFPGTQLGSEISFGLDLQVSNRSAYEPAAHGGTHGQKRSANGGSTDGFATLGMVAGTGVTLRQRLLPSCCVDPACRRYRCGDMHGVCEGAARRNATYSCRADGTVKIEKGHPWRCRSSTPEPPQGAPSGPVQLGTPRVAPGQ